MLLWCEMPFRDGVFPRRRELTPILLLRRWDGDILRLPALLIRSELISSNIYCVYKRTTSHHDSKINLFQIISQPKPFAFSGTFLVCLYLIFLFSVYNPNIFILYIYVCVVECVYVCRDHCLSVCVSVWCFVSVSLLICVCVCVYIYVCIYMCARVCVCTQVLIEMN